MCGIAGYCGTRPIEPERLERTLAAMRHRGPDHAGHRSFRRPDGKTVHLLSTRLDIIDLAERSNQPFRFGDTWLSYNGELYNYLEVRAELQARGVVFTTASDTEVLAAALAGDGAAALDRCEGMWAFAAYDERTGDLLLARDRFGEKPLHLYRDDSGIYWGSETSLIAELLGRRLEPNLDHVRRFLVNGYKALHKQPQSFFAGVEELPPATTLRVGAGGGEQLARYWSPSSGETAGLAYDEAVAAVRERLLRAVEIRLRADVPLAFCMSGGIDSLSLISIAKNVFDYDVHGFTIVNEDARYEEQDMVEHAVEALGVRHTAIPLRRDAFLPQLRGLVRHRGAPLYTITYFAHWLLMAAIAEHGYRISVSGTAADELFTGYYDHHLAYLHEIRGDAELHEPALAAWREHVQPLVRNPYLRDPDLFADDPSRRDYVYLNAEEFAGYLHDRFDEPFAETRYVDGLLRNRMLNELFHEAVPVILHEDDLNAMYYSIENRSPFLDRPLFELSTAIPTRHLVRNGYAKAVLRDAMRGIVPDRILDNRRKVGFNAPIAALLDTRDPETRAALLADGPIFELVRRDAVEALLDKELLPNSESKFLFNFVNSKLFLEEFA